MNERNPHLLKMSQGRQCVLGIPSVCVNDTSTTVACHSNQLKHGKGRGIKASDQYTVWGCVSCHQWLDQGSAPRDDKTMYFDFALNEMKAEYQKIIDAPALLMKSAQKDKDAARWALERLQ